MIKRWKVVQCSLCRKESPMKRVGDPYDTWWDVPEGWVKINRETHFCQDCNEAINKYKNSISTDDVPEVKHAAWLYNRNNEYETGIHTAECSNCRVTQSVEFYQRKPIFDYCPFCGARMDGEQK